MKLGTLIKHDEITCVVLKNHNSCLYIPWSNFPLIIFHTISCPPYNLKTVREISVKLSTLIKHDEMMCHAQELLLLLSYLWSYFPLIIFPYNFMSTL